MLTWLAALTIVDPAIAFGPNRQFISMPEQGTKPAGFILTASSEDIQWFGDIPFRVDISSTAGPFAATRSLVIRIKPVGDRSEPGGRDFIYELPIQLDQGATTARQTFYLPKWPVGGEFVVTVLENRAPLDGYNAVVPGKPLTPNDADSLWLESVDTKYAWITNDNADKPDTRILLAAVAPELLGIMPIQSSTAEQIGVPVRSFQYVQRDNLPRDWRGFAAADIWIVRPDTLASITSENPEVSIAFQQFLLCGGTLWIFGDIDDAKVISAFKIPMPLPKNTESVIADVLESVTSVPFFERLEPYSVSQRATFNVFRSYLRDVALQNSQLAATMSGPSTNYADVAMRLFEANVQWLETMQADESTPTTASDFRVFPIALGSIVMCKKDIPLPATLNDWQSMKALSLPNISFAFSRAVDPCFGDRRYWDWIIPDVAQPPVYMFIGLLFVFTIIVGPLSYYYFGRLGRGYLMMFVAPLMALLTTLMMLAYGLVADGLSIRARVREITWIGDRDENAVRYNRATYFAGIRPLDGLVFPGNASIAGYNLATAENWFEGSLQESGPIGTVRLGDAIELDRGFLPSRQQKQFITYFPVKKVGTLAFTDSSLGRIKNTSAMMMRDGVIRNAAGNYFGFDIVEAGGESVTRPLLAPDAAELLSVLYTNQRPIAPAGVLGTRRQGEYTMDLISGLQTRAPEFQAGIGGASSGESQIEAWLRLSLQINSQLPVGMFVALSDVTPDCVAVPSAVLDESIHFVIGVMP